VLLERERELASLDAMVADARAGSGRLAVIEAAAGLGKTRLLQAAREAGQQAGMRVLSARATELERDFPFALVRQLLEPPLATLDAPAREALLEGAAGAARGPLGIGGDAPADAFAVLHGLYWLTAALAEQRPLLLAVDDAHWSDAASLDYLGFVLPRLEELPLLLAIACRPDEAGAESSLARIATDGLARRLTPSALSRSAAGALLADELDGEPEDAFAPLTCHEVSGGNPFLLCELARTLAAQGVSPSAGEAERVRALAPERVTRTVLVRLARLSPDARGIARALVALGDDADVPLLAEYAGLDVDDALAGADELRAAAILDPGASPRFIHPLVRTALDADVPAGERAASHVRAAALLHARGASPLQLAAHLVATEPRGERATVETLLAAGEQALANAAPRSAIAYLTRALREPAPADLRAAVLHPLITASIRAADDSVFTAIEGDVLAELERTPSLRSRWALKLTVWMMLSGRRDQAIPLLEQAIEVAAQENDIDRAFRLEAQLSRIAELPLATTRARLARYSGRFELDSASGRLTAALEAQWHAIDGDRPAAVEAARRAMGNNGRIFAEQPEFLAPGSALLTLILADELDDAQQGAERALELARERSATPELIGAWWLNALVAYARGDLAAAEADARQALALARLSGLLFAVPPLLATLVEALIARGELRSAEHELAASGMAGDLPPVGWLAMLLLARGRLRLEQGAFEAAAEDLLALVERRQSHTIANVPALQARTYAARALMALDRCERAREQARAALDDADRWGAPSATARALCALGLATGGERGIELLTRAVAVLDGSPAWLARMYALCDLGAALRRANRRAEAREPLREALELARRCGAAGVAKRAHDELLATGEKVRRYTPLGVESLTPSERRVAEMAATGLTNRQIAQTLFLTVKTIEAHLAATYDKLGIHSRRELASALGGPVEPVTGR
jgi:DNA-binding CsgD family transcriptional regulator